MLGGAGVKTFITHCAIMIYFPYIDSLTFLLAGNQFIFCKEVVVATYV